MPAESPSPFTQAKTLAKKTSRDPKKLNALLNSAVRKLKKLPGGDYEDKWEDLVMMIRLVKAYHLGCYQKISKENFLLALSAIVYFVSSSDWIPDDLEAIGLIDDAAIVGAVFSVLKDDLEEFLAWENMTESEKVSFVKSSKKK
jgi:uncharacterized membrane protein YkvA (DUF1232 family)